jgi:hypothetical protein
MTAPDWHPHGYESSGAENDLTDSQARHVANAGREHHLTGPAHYEAAELALEEAHRIITAVGDRSQAWAIEGQAWATVAHAHTLLAQTAVFASMLEEQDAEAWATVIL